MSHKKFGPDRFSRFDVYWIQTNKRNRQTDRQTSQIYIDVLIFKDRTLKKNNIERTRISMWFGREMMRMWFGLEIDVVGLPPLG